eukprot:14263602-Alexandrium_andersonii.AAC.1
MTHLGLQQNCSRGYGAQPDQFFFSTWLLRCGCLAMLGLQGGGWAMWLTRAPSAALLGTTGRNAFGSAAPSRL